MSKPAARIGDMHMCPMVTPGLPPVPHVGGPITGPGCPTVLIGNMPAAVVGDMCTCVGPPSSVILGSTGVFIGGKPAARMGDMTAHGGTITVGFPTVLIGEMSPGGTGSGMAEFSALPKDQQAKALENIDKEYSTSIMHINNMIVAANLGLPFIKNSSLIKPSTVYPSGVFDNIVSLFQRLLGTTKAKSTLPENIVKDVNPNNGTINCGWIIDSVIDRVTGKNPNAITERTDQDGTWKDIEKRHNTKFENKKDFEEIFNEVKAGGHGTTQIIGLGGSENAHVVVMVNNNGTPMILEAQGGGQVIDSADKANELYNPNFYGEDFFLISAPIK